MRMTKATTRRMYRTMDNTKLWKMSSRNLKSLGWRRKRKRKSQPKLSKRKRNQPQNPKSNKLYATYKKRRTSIKKITSDGFMFIFI